MTKLQAALMLGAIQEILGRDAITTAQVSVVNDTMTELYESNPEQLKEELSEMVPELYAIITKEDF